MRQFTLFRAAALTAAISIPLSTAPLALAQSNLTPQQIQAQIANGQEVTALSELNVILQSNPHSGVGWYLTAEAQDASGNEAAARAAYNNAQSYAPGLPFADPAKAAALKSHIDAGSQSNPQTNAQPGAYAPAPARHGSPLIPLLIILGVGFFVIRMLMRRRYARPYQQPGQAYNPGYNPGGMPYGPGGGMGGGIGGGIGSGLLGGLAAGAGFAAGERVIDDMMGNRNQNIDQTSFDQPNVDPGPQDDGLSGNGGWDDNGGGGIDPNSSW